MADLRALQELCTWMRKAGVVYARTGDLELRLDAAPVADVAPTGVEAAGVPSGHDEPPPRDAEADDLETLLYSSGAEAGPFLAAINRARRSAA